MAAATETREVAATGAAAQVSPHNSSLYVGDLDREATESQLYELFQQVGPVASIRVCRDAVTRRSLGYAYVNYNSTLDPGAADRALGELNYTPVNGRPIRIMWSHRDPSFRKSGVGNIFIKNLDKSIDNKELHDTFSAFGNILSCKVATDPQSNSKGYGFVHFETQEAAEQAILKVNGKQLKDKIVYVGPFLKRTDRTAGKEMRFTNVYVKNLDADVDDQEFENLAREFGDITSAIVMRDDNGKSKGFGFINYLDADSAQRAVDTLQGQERNGRKMYAGRAQKKAEREAMLKQKYEEIRQERIAKYQGMNLYIKNLVDDVEDDKLREEFAAFGTITSAKIMRDEKGKSKGFGFVCYTTNEEATRAVTEMNGKMFRGKPLYVALAQRKEVRRAQLEQQYAQRVALSARQGGPGGPMPGMFPPGAPPPMFYGGPPGAGGMGPPGPRGGMMYQQMLPRGMPQGRGPRGPGIMPQQGMLMMGPGGRGAGRGARGGPRGAPPPKEGFRARGQLRGQGRGPKPPPPQQPPSAPLPSQPPAAPPAPAAPAPPPAPAAVVPPAAATQGAVVPQSDASQAPLTTAMLAAAPPDQQKQMLGERLFPSVQRLQPDLAGKITGMLLEMDNSEVLLLLESPESLESKVEEAISVLKQHNAIPEGTVVQEMKALAVA